MKLNFTHTATVLLALTINWSVNAQTTYTINSSTNYTSLTPSASWCTGCVFNLNAGVTLTMNTTAGCVNCTFNGGTILVSSGFAFQGGTFYNDSVAVTSSSTSFQVSSTASPVFRDGKVEFQVGITCQACSFDTETVHIDVPTGKTLTLQSSGSFTTTTFAGDSVIANSGSIYMNSLASITGSKLYLNSVNLKSDVGKFLLDRSHLYLYGSSSFTQSSSPLVLKDTSTIVVGDGSNGSLANMQMTMSAGGVQIDDMSSIGVANGSNYYMYNNPYTYTSASGATTSYNTTSNTVSCGAGHTNACKPNYVYGCATMNYSGLNGCVTLAIAVPELSARLSAPGSVYLSWEGVENSNAAGYTIQRSTNGYDWSGITTMTADAYNNDYQYTDISAPAGTVYYRLLQTDRDNKLTYSAITTVGVTAIASTVSISPNPVTGRSFTLKTASPQQLSLNVYNLGGQLLFQTMLEGQTSYSVQLPASVAAGQYLVIRTLSRGNSAAFTVLNR